MPPRLKVGGRVVLALVGMFLTINESIHHGPERPSLYVVWVAMMGLSVLPTKWGE